MHDILKNPRHGCDLHGAIQTIEELRGAVPIVHANAGCVYQNYLAQKAGHLVNGGVYGPEIPATEVIEKQVIFGGASRLREEIKNTAKVINGELYIVLGSCEAAMVGDDLKAMTKEAADINLPVISYFSAGFKGGSHWGYQNLMKAIIRQIPSVKKIPSGKIKGLVNILGVLPKTDIFYKGDLEEIKRLLAGAGIKANIFFGPQGAVKELEQSAQAEHTLVFSRWGLAAAQQLNEQYGTPYTVFDCLPLGLEDVENFFSRISPLIQIDSAGLAEFLERERERFSYYTKALADTYYTQALQKSAAIVGDAGTVIRIGAFLKKYLGALIHTAVITDAYHGKNGEKPQIPDNIAGELFCSDDSGEIGQIIRDTDVEIVLGSSLEAPIAGRLELPYLTVSSPSRDKVILHKTYAGLEGAYFLLEDYANAVLKNNALLKAKQRRFVEGINI
jgi:nitrogenase molybdenum-iron protein beta chain